MELISKQTYMSMCASEQIVYSDESNYKDICKELRSNTDTNFVLITHCEHDNIIEPINIPRNITKWFVSDLNLKHHKKEAIPTGHEIGMGGSRIPVVYYDESIKRGLGIFYNPQDQNKEKTKILETVKKSVPCSVIIKDSIVTKSYPFLLEFMIATTEQEAYTTLLGRGVAVVNNKKIVDMYNDVPILFVEKWGDISKSILQQTYAVFQNKPFQMNTLTPEYWRQKIWKAAGH